MSITVRSLGGSGEDSRSCFLVSWPGGSLLLDCGVRRELHVPVSRVYPALTPQIARSLTAVLLSHAHEDHTAALPYLYELGYRGPVYATAETLALVPGFLRKWADYVKAGGDVLPFREENIRCIDFRPLSLGDQTVEGIHLSAGRSGHMLGSCWYQLRLGGQALLYTGDLAPDGLLLAMDPLPPSQLMILECAYAGRHLQQAGQYAALLASVQETVAQGGKVLLPVPANGRGIDLYLYLKAQGVPLCVERAVVSSARELAAHSRWLRQTPLWDALEETPSPADDAARQAVAGQAQGVAILSPDGMLTSAAALCYYDALKGDPKNKILITGHTSAGTVGNSVLQPQLRARLGVQAPAQQITIKVHPDQDDALGLALSCGAQQVMLFHADASACQELVRSLEARGIACVCGTAEDLSLDC